MGSNSEENVKLEHIIDCRVSEGPIQHRGFACHSSWTIFQHSRTALCGLLDSWIGQILTFWDRGVDFDDEELAYQEEDKPAIKVSETILLCFALTMFF